MNMNCYAVQCLTGREKDVASRIQDAGIKAIVPMRILSERRGGVWRRAQRVIFPGYVFVMVPPPLNPADYYAIRRTCGVLRVLGIPRPMPLLEEEVTLILQMTMEGDPLGISDVFMIGGQVMVIEGPLKGLEGSVVKIFTRRRRARVKITLMGEPRTVELAINVIRKA